MPFDLRIRSVPKPDSKVWELDCVSWLRRSSFPGADPFRRIHLVQGYRDSVAVLTAEELREWHDLDRHHASESPYDSGAWQRVLQPKIESLEQILSEHPIPPFFMAWRYEWESGMN